MPICVHRTDRRRRNLLQMFTHRKQEGTEADRAENGHKDS